MKRAHEEDTRQSLDAIKATKYDKTRGKDDGCANFPTFSMRGAHQFDNKFPYFREPREVGSFSQDPSRQFLCDKSQLKYVVTYPPNSHINFNLRKGFKEMIKKDGTNLEYINDLLRWVLSQPKAFTSMPLVRGDNEANNSSVELTSLSTDFVCWRGLLTKLLCTPYETREGWQIAVTLFRGTYFLCDFETEEKKKQEESRTERQEEMCYWGWKFEQYVTSKTEGGEPDAERPVNNNEGFCSVVRSRLNKNSLVYGGEIDGIDPTIKNKNMYVEYKTTRRIDSPKQDINFKKFKLLKWWAQSFLVGITKIICGFRDDNGIVHSLEEFNTQHIPDEVKDLHNPWKANVCFNFMDQVLNFIKEKVTLDNPRAVHLLEYIPGKDISLRRVNVVCDPKYQFIPDWFINWEGWEKTKP